MQVNETTNEGLKRVFSITVPADDIEGQIETRLKELGKKVKVDGFRPGKVPMSVLKKRYEDAVMGEVLDKAVQEAAQSTLGDRDLRPAAQPKIEVVTFEKGKDLEFTIDMEVLPEIGNLDLSKISITRPKAEVDDSAINEALERIASSNSTTEPVTASRKSKNGDVAVIDFKGSVGGVEFPGGAGKDHHLELGSGSFIPGFEEQLVGAKAGDSVTVDVTFPEEYHSKDLAGKAAQFAVEVKELRQTKAAELNDDLAKSVGKEDLSDLKGAVREELERQYNSVSRSKAKQNLLDALAETFVFDIPETMATQEFEDIWKQIEHAKEHGHLDPEDEGKSDEELRDEYTKLAARRVRLGLMLSEVGRLNNITVDQQDLNRAIMAEAQKYPGQEAAVFQYYTQNQQAMESLRMPIYEDKVVDYMLEMAKVTDQVVSAEELFAVDEPAAEKKPAKKAAAKKKAPAKKKDS